MELIMIYKGYLYIIYNNNVIIFYNSYKFALPEVNSIQAGLISKIVFTVPIQAGFTIDVNI
jgi:hypothetical protein